MRSFIPFIVVLVACGGAEPTPSGATCPPGSTLTYAGFAQPFMTAYCTRCHSSELHGPDRHGAPIFHDFDTELGILNVGGHVDEQAAAGPDAINKLMPASGAGPTEAERYQLGEWLVCATENLGRPDARLVDAMPDAPRFDAAPVDAE